MQAVELAGENKRPAVLETTKIIEKVKEKGLLLGRAGLFNNVLRIAPPLNIRKNDVDTAIKIFDQSLDEVLR